MNNILKITDGAVNKLIGSGVRSKVYNKKEHGVTEFNCQYDKEHSSIYYEIVFENEEYLTLFVMEFAEYIELYKNE